MIHTPLPVLGFVAWSGTGKTTLLRQVLPRLCESGLRVGMVKHAHHSFDVDTPGKDSFELRRAGAQQVLVASRLRWALMAETPAADEPVLAEVLPRFDSRSLDLILVEGFKHETFPKLEIYRASVGKPPLYPADASVLAVATDGPLAPAPCIPVLDLNRPDAIARFVIEYATSWGTPRERATAPGSAR